MIRLPHIELKRDLRKPRASGDDPGSEAQYKEKGA